MANRRRVALDPWDVRHLLLSMDDRTRDEQDQDDLDRVLQRVVGALDALPAARSYALASPRGSDSRVEAFPAWWFETNAWLYAPTGRGGECVVVDVPPAPLRLLRHLERERLHLSAVVLTHGHVDHAGGVGAVVRALGRDVPVYVHEADAALVLEPTRAAGPLARTIGTLSPPPEDFVISFRDGDELNVGSRTMLALHTPGHTAGSSCLLSVDGTRRLLFTGDHLFAGGAGGRCDLGGGSREQLVASTLRKLTPLGDDVIVLPGHGAPTTIGAARAAWLARGAPPEPDELVSEGPR